MPYFTCKICQQQIAYATADYNHFYRHDWECNECYVVLGKQRYPVNLAGSTTLFSPMGMALGDRIIQQVIREQYAKDNPDERVIHLGYCDPVEALKEYKPTKFFWANVTSMMKQPDDPRIHWFSLCREADWYADQGIYPRLDFEPVMPQNFGLQKFVVLHIRYVSKAPVKNAEPFIINRVIEYLFSLYQAKHIDGVVLVGNDQHPQEVYLPKGLCVDLRNNLILPEIAWLCQQAQVVIGKDSGIPHLAAAAGGKVVSWGYTSRNWFPKAPKDRFTSFMADDSDWQVICDAVKEKGGFV